MDNHTVTEMEESLACAINALKFLCSPQPNRSVTTEDNGDTSPEFISGILQENLQRFYNEIQTSDKLRAVLGEQLSKNVCEPHFSLFAVESVSHRDKFVEACLCLLHRVHRFLHQLSSAASDGKRESPSSHPAASTMPSAPQPTPGTLSAPQIQTLISVVQFLVVLGLSPFLSPGVGIPVSQRLGPGQVLLATSHDFSVELSPLSRVQRLLPATKLLCDLLDLPSLADSVLQRHLADILAGLMQLRFSCRTVLNQRQKVASSHTPKDKVQTNTNKSNLDQSSQLSNQQIKVARSNTAVNKAQIDTNNSNVDQNVFMSKNLSNQEVESKDVTKANQSEHEAVNEIEEGDRPLYPSSVDLSCLYSVKHSPPWTLNGVRQHCNVYIDRAVRMSGSQHVLQTLLLMSSGGKPSSTAAPVKAPTWYQRSVAGLLRDVLMDTGGVANLIAVILSDNPDVHDWHKCRAVAQVIAHLPTNPGNIQQFYTAITQQLLEILLSPSESLPLPSIRAVGATVAELNTQHPVLVQAGMLEPLQRPLIELSTNNKNLSSCEDGVVVSEQDLTVCLKCLHRLYVLGQEPHSSLLSSLQGVAAILFDLFLASRKTVSSQRTEMRAMLTAYLSQCDPSNAVACILGWLSHGANDESGAVSDCLHPSISVSSGPGGCLQATVTPPSLSPQEESLDSWTEPVEAVMEVLAETRTGEIVPTLFIALLQKLTGIVQSELGQGENTPNSWPTNVKLPSRVLSPSQRTSRLAELRVKVTLVSLLAEVGEKYGEAVISSGSHVIMFAKATLERCVQVCQASTDASTVQFEWETVSMAMGLLTAVLGAGIDIGDQSELLEELLPLMTYISSSPAADPRVREMADDLKVAVATKGLVWAELSRKKADGSTEGRETGEGKKTTQHQPPRSEPSEKKLIEVLSETSLKETSQSDKKATESLLNQALHEVCDPMLPVRGHGLIALARLLDDRSEEVIHKKDILLKVFLENLTHSDSYIYLTSVNGLAALADLCPDKVVPCLTSELQNKCSASESSGEMVLKLGEAVVKATRRLGEMTPKYRDILLASMLCGCRHSDPLTRASCLSGLADVCRLLRFSLGPVIHEIVTCCRDVLKSDLDPEPRKAAALTFTLILRGLGTDTITTLGDVLTELYRVLKQSATRDLDSGVRVQATLALEELDSIMRNAIFAKPNLSKKISILGYQ